MISHDYKCIFIHIPPTAGSSIEEWIVGRDWWDASPPTKHLWASQARREYAEYWGDYFKFTIVRDPVKRMRSCLRFPEYSFLRLDQAGEIRMEEYLLVFSRNGIVLEYDWRFYERDEVELPRHVTHSLYGNFLDEELDYVGRVENLDELVRTLRERTGIDRPFTSHLQASPPSLATLEVTEQTRRDIENLFWRDYVRFEFEASSGFEAPSGQQDDVRTARSAQGERMEVMHLRNKVSELRLTRQAYRSLVDELNEKNRTISILQQTVQSLIVDRDGYKSAVEESKGPVDPASLDSGGTSP